MAGSGFMKHMSNTIRNNRDLLRKKSMFKKERTFLRLKKEDFKTADFTIESKKLTQKETKEIKDKITNERRKDNQIAIIGVSFIIIPLLFLSINIFNRYQEEETLKQEVAAENYLSQNLNEYTFLLQDDDKWLAQGNINNAIYRYEQAIKLFPNEFDANYKLLVAYSISCKNNNCSKGLKIFNRLKKQYGSDERILKLESIFVNKTNTTTNNKTK